MTFDDLLKAIAEDCVKDDRRSPSEDFTSEQMEKYRKLAPGEFWGGYAYLDVFGVPDGELCGFIRLYSPQGSGKWCFTVKDGEVSDIDHA